jgi:hypothetical protein
VSKVLELDGTCIRLSTKGEEEEEEYNLHDCNGDQKNSVKRRPSLSHKR